MPAPATGPLRGKQTLETDLNDNGIISEDEIMGDFSIFLHTFWCFSEFSTSTFITFIIRKNSLCFAEVRVCFKD